MDFLIGFSIFLLALIMVLTMIPGIFAGLESAQIDYDAVAYRTSVILCEDPGWPADQDPWETLDTVHVDDIERLGLAISSVSPNILSKEKVSSFFNNNNNLVLTEENYRSKAIFGDVPYYYNISLKIEDDPVNTTGNVAPDSGYGYMRRLVKFKEPGYAMINSALHNASSSNLSPSFTIYTEFSVLFNYSELQNKSIDEPYRFMPQSEPASVTIFNFYNSFADNNITNVTLKEILLKRKRVSDTGFNTIAGNFSKYDNDTYRFFIDGTPHTMKEAGGIVITTADELRYEMYAPLWFSDEVGTSISLQFKITYEYFGDDGTIPHYYMSGDFPYIYGEDYMTEPYLRDGAMEVLIW